MLDISNPLGFINDFINQRKINQWILLGIEVAGSALVAMLFVTGGALAVHRPPWEALGEGMGVTATVIAKLLRASALTKGMQFVWPGKEADAEMNAGLQTLTK